MNKKIVSIVLSSILAASSYSVSAFAATQNKDDNVVKIIGSNTDPYTLLGLLPTFCKKQGLDVQYTQKNSAGFDSSSGMIQALDRQGFDLATGTLGSALVAAGKGVDIRVFANVTSGGSALISRPGLNTYQSLKGKKVAILKGQHSEQIISDAFEKRGLSTTGANADVKVVNFQTDAQPIAFEQGLIDAFNATYPFSQQYIDSGKAVLIEDYKQVTRAVYTTSKFPQHKETKLRACYQDMMNAVNNPKRIKEVEQAQADATAAGYRALTPPKTSIAYTATPLLANEHIVGLLRFLRSIDKVPLTFTVPAEFNQSYKFTAPK